MAPSRLVDDFRLDLALSAPEQREEDAVRDFVHWLDQIQITDTGGPFPTLAQFEDALRLALAPATSPPDADVYFRFGSPLAGLRVHPADVCEYLRAAFRIWVTEIRPLFHGSGVSSQSCSGATGTASAPADGLLLAEIDVPLVRVGPGLNWRVDDLHPVTIDESRRPVLLHLRMQQGWQMCGLRTGK
jgi:hypothetical protein